MIRIWLFLPATIKVLLVVRLAFPMKDVYSLGGCVKLAPSEIKVTSFRYSNNLP